MVNHHFPIVNHHFHQVPGLHLASPGRVFRLVRDFQVGGGGQPLAQHGPPRGPVVRFLANGRHGRGIACDQKDDWNIYGISMI